VAQFDQSTWKTRATRRFDKAHVEGRKRAAADFLRDITSIDQMAKVIDWCIDHGIEVHFNRTAAGEGGEYDWSGKVTVDSRSSRELQLFTILHEVGHFLTGEMRSDVVSSRRLRTITYRVDIVDYELEAWKRGLNLARDLGLNLDERRYNRARSVYVKTYMAWALRVNGYGEGIG
jgi:hypothetical protein